MDGDHIQAVIEILAKGSSRHFLRKVPVRRRDHAQVHLLANQRPYGAVLVLLQHPQELHLQFQRQVADLVEERGAAVGQIDQAPLRLAGAGECALGVAEQLALHQRSDQRPAIDRDKMAGRIAVVDGPGDDFLAHTCFAEQQHGRSGPREFFDKRPNLTDRL